jgi:hypothetical protein
VETATRGNLVVACEACDFVEASNSGPLVAQDAKGFESGIDFRGERSKVE